VGVGGDATVGGVEACQVHAPIMPVDTGAWGR
jgi:hypothetical protein